MTRLPHPARRWTVPAVVLATLALFVLRFGYDWGTSDQDEFLPLLLHMAQPGLLASDAFVSMQQDTWSVRSAFVWLLHGLRFGVVPLGAVVLVVYVLSWVTSALAIARLTTSYSTGTLAPLLSVPAVLLVTVHWAPGGNDIVYSMLVPEMVAWSLALWAAVKLTSASSRAVVSGLLCGLATWMHVLVGLQLGVVFLLWLMMDRSRRAHVVGFGVTWLLLSGPPVYLVLAGVGLGAESTYILTHVRAPHHYLPGHVPVKDWLYFAALLTAAAFSLYRYPEYFRTGKARPQLVQLVSITTMLLTGGLVLVALWPTGPWTAAQPFKLAVPVRVLSVITISCLAGSELSRRLPVRLAHGLRRLVAPAALIVVVSSGILIALSSYWHDRALPFRSAERVQMYTLAHRVRSETTPQAIVVVPPDWTGFQFASKRAQWVSFKAFPFEEDAVMRWKEQLERIGTTVGDYRGMEWRSALATSYRTRATDAWRRVLDRVDATHALLPQAHAPQPRVFCEQGWCLVELSRILAP